MKLLATVVVFLLVVAGAVAQDGDYLFCQEIVGYYYSLCRISCFPDELPEDIVMNECMYTCLDANETSDDEWCHYNESFPLTATKKIYWLCEPGMCELPDDECQQACCIYPACIFYDVECVECTDPPPAPPQNGVWIIGVVFGVIFVVALLAQLVITTV